MFKYPGSQETGRCRYKDHGGLHLVGDVVHRLGLLCYEQSTTARGIMLTVRSITIEVLVTTISGIRLPAILPRTPAASRKSRGIMAQTLCY